MEEVIGGASARLAMKSILQTEGEARLKHYVAECKMYDIK